MSTDKPTIIYTKTDEAPFLATHSLLPILEHFLQAAGIDIETKDISLAGRIIANFPENLQPEQRQPDDLAALGKMVLERDANIIKLPNISASIPQLQDAIAELQSQGYDIPDYPENPANDEERDIQARYDAIKGSAVNPVLRQGNSDRRAPDSIKAFAKENPHSMGEWAPTSQTHVSSMEDGDFHHNEKSTTTEEETTVKIELVGNNGEIITVLKEGLALQKGEILDSTMMSRSALREFLAEQIVEAEERGILFSLHMKATMMKKSDPIIFGQAVEVFFQDAFKKHAQTFAALNIDSTNGLGDVYDKIQSLPEAQRKEIEADLLECMEKQAGLMAVDSDKGITNLHVPSDIIIDASIPAAIKAGGKAWNMSGNTQDVKIVIPDSSYADVYAATVDFCRKHGAFDPTTMGTVPNVGLMAQKAEEYGSHDKTFEIAQRGTVRVTTADGTVISEHAVEAGDIWRACQTKDAPIKDWVKLAVNRAEASGAPAVFWLDKNRPHDAELIKKVSKYLKDHDTEGLDIQILSPVEATELTLERLKNGKETISVTGNVLRDYLTDLFPILEVGTSAKMLSIVPLMNGGGLFETGAGGSAPKHVQQLVSENHLRWDSLGEFFALVPSLEHLSEVCKNAKAKTMATALDAATTTFLKENKSPSRKVGELDNRGSHFYLAKYWAEELAAQQKDAELSEFFIPLAQQLADHEEQIVKELNAAQGKPVDLKGYYKPKDQQVDETMCPSSTLNRIISLG